MCDFEGIFGRRGRNPTSRAALHYLTDFHLQFFPPSFLLSSSKFNDPSLSGSPPRRRRSRHCHRARGAAGDQGYRQARRSRSASLGGGGGLDPLREGSVSTWGEYGGRRMENIPHGVQRSNSVSAQLAGKGILSTLDCFSYGMRNLHENKASYFVLKEE